jgi:quercetin dioxygenase-like cupin family protein
MPSLTRPLTRRASPRSRSLPATGKRCGSWAAWSQSSRRPRRPAAASRSSSTWRRGAGSPLHVHRHEDEWFYVLDGELTFWVDGEVTVAPAGSFVYGPRGLPHTFVVSSEQARFVLVTEPAGFETFVRTLAEPAERAIPPAATEPPDVVRLAAVAAEHGLEILGPPGIPA